MNALERLRRTFRFEKTDRPPVMMQGAWPATFLRWEAEGLPANHRETNYFGMDPAPSTGVMLGTCFWSPFIPRFTKRMVSQDEEYQVFWDPNGRLMKQRQGELDQSVGEYLRFPVTSRADWEAVKSRLDPSNPERYEGLAAAAQRQRSRPDEPVTQILSGPYRLLWHLFGDVGLCYALHDDPEMIKDIMRTWLALNCGALDTITAQMDVHFLTIMEDMSCNTGMMLSPAHFTAYMAPYYKELIAHAKRRSAYFGTMVDTDGNVEELIPLLLDCGVTAMTPFEVQAGMDVVDLRRRYGQRLVIKGGIDKRVLAKGRPDIDREIERVLPTFLKTGGYIVCLDHQAPPDIPLDNYMYFLQQVRRYSGAS